jgi:hypothetical protein
MSVVSTPPPLLWTQSFEALHPSVGMAAWKVSRSYTILQPSPIAFSTIALGAKSIFSLGTLSIVLLRTASRMHQNDGRRVRTLVCAVTFQCSHPGPRVLSYCHACVARAGRRSECICVVILYRCHCVAIHMQTSEVWSWHHIRVLGRLPRD